MTKIKYTDVKNYFNNGLWDENRVKKALELKIITEKQFDKIVKPIKESENEK